MVMALIGIVMFRAIRKILKKESQLVKGIKTKSSILEIKNKDMVDSIQYAKSI